VGDPLLDVAFLKVLRVKPFAIAVAILLAVGSLALVVVIARSPAAKPKSAGGDKATVTQDDLPIPPKGPYGKVLDEGFSFDFGQKMVGDEDTHSFVLKNVGEGVLNFKLGKPTCQCTVGEITKDGQKIEEGPLAPGESVSIKVRWVMKAQMEHFRQSVPVFTTDPDMRKVEFEIIGSVENPVYIHPDSPWNFGDLSEKEPSAFEGFVGSKVFEQFEVEEQPRDNPKVKLTLRPATEDELQAHSGRSGYIIRADVSPNVPIGVLRESIKFKIKHGELENILEFSATGRRSGPIEVRGSVGAGYTAGANRLIFRDFPAAEGAKAKLTFFIKGIDSELELQGLEPKDTRYQVKFLGPGKTFGASKMYEVEIAIPPGPPARHRENQVDSVELKFNHPDAPDFKIMLDYNATR